MDLREKSVFFLKGICMGLADIVPGVSGGTIALITGIYERLIEAIESIKPGGKNKIDLEFLLPLGAGIIIAFILASRVILFLLETYRSYIFSFFFGLIAASAIVVYRRTAEHTKKTLLLSLVGFIFSFYVVGLESLSLMHGVPMVFISGFLAICAMLLPGISGSFVLLFLGQYEYMLNVLHSVSSHWQTLTVFVTGAVVSLFTFSRTVGWFLRKDEEGTLAFLIGLMVGALRLPASKISPGFTLLNTVGLLVCGVGGLLFVIIIEG